MIYAVNMKETLSSYVSRIMREKDLSGYDVERRSKKGITQSHVNRVQNGLVSNLSVQKVRALAKGLDVPEAELSAVARGESLHTGDMAHSRLAAIDFAYEGMPKKKKEKADYIIELLEREIKRITEEPGE